MTTTADINKARKASQAFHSHAETCPVCSNSHKLCPKGNELRAKVKRRRQR